MPSSGGDLLSGIFFHNTLFTYNIDETSKQRKQYEH